MGLKQAITEIAGHMEEEAKEDPNVPVGGLLRMYARMLRTAVQAAADESPSPSVPDLSATDAARIAKSLAREELRKAERAEQRDGARIVQFANGPHEGSFVEIPAGVPDRAKTAEYGGVHELRGEKWHYLSDGKTTTTS